MLLSVRARRTSRRKVTAHSTFSVLLRDQEWLGRAGHIVLSWHSSRAAEPPRCADTPDRAAELLGCDYRGQSGQQVLLYSSLNLIITVFYPHRRYEMGE
ncbi:hypothetical protein AAC387_Pa09g1600 [Persea americana]